jgi:hypothetical protein
MLGPILPACVRSIARVWPNSQTRKNAGDGTVTFIAGPPHEFLRILSPQESGGMDTDAADRAPRTNLTDAAEKKSLGGKLVASPEARSPFSAGVEHLRLVVS